MPNKDGTKSGGRLKGTPNKDRKDLMDMIMKVGCKHPIEGLATVAVRAEEAEDDKLAFQCYSELAPYIAAKRKAIEVTGEGGGPVEHTLDTSQLNNATLRAILAAQLPDEDDG